MKRLSILSKWMCVSLLSAGLLAGCNPQNQPPAPKYTIEIENALSLSKTMNSYAERDQVLQNAVAKARTIADIRALGAAANRYEVRDQILLKGLALAQNTSDYLALSGDANNYSTRDQILIKATAQCTTIDDLLKVTKAINTYDTSDKMLLSRVDLAKTVKDYQRLAGSAHSYSVRDQILSMGAKELAVNTSVPTKDNGTILADVNSEIIKAANQDLPKAYEAMQKAQKAYTEAIAKGESDQKVKDLNKVYLEKKTAYEALGGL